MIDGERRGSGLVFVGGCPRSGTTLVQLILDSHPDVCGGPEFDRVPEILELRNKLRASVDSGRISLYCSREDVDREIALLIERLLTPYAEKRGCSLISEKTPWNVLVFQELLEIFPGAKLVFCVRDPRAVAASMLQVGRRAQKKGSDSPGFTKNLRSAIRTIWRSNNAGFIVANESKRVFTVVYERLVNEPEREIRRLCDFLSLPWSEEMLGPGEKLHTGEKSLDGVWYTDEMFRSNPDPTRANKWENELTPAQQTEILVSFKNDENLKALGYRLSDELSPAATSRVILQLHARLRSGLENMLLGLASSSMKSVSLRRFVLKLYSLAREKQP